jgi:hypothetical protein
MVTELQNGELKGWNSIPEGARDIVKKWYLKL